MTTLIGSGATIDDFFASLDSIPYFNVNTTIKSEAIVNLEFGGTSIDLLLDSQIMIVTGKHADVVLSVGKRLRAPLCYWSSEKNQTIISFGKDSLGFIDKAKAIVMILAIVPIDMIVNEAFSDKKIIVFKYVNNNELSVFLTKDACIFVKERKHNRPFIKELDRNAMEEKLKDPETAENTINELAEASDDKTNQKPKQHAVYGDAVEED